MLGAAAGGHPSIKIPPFDLNFFVHRFTLSASRLVSHDGCNFGFADKQALHWTALLAPGVLESSSPQNGKREAEDFGELRTL